MSSSVHMIFAPTGCLRRRASAYYRIHASLVESYRHAKSAARTKRQRSILKSRIFKQQGETDG